MVATLISNFHLSFLIPIKEVKHCGSFCPFLPTAVYYYPGLFSWSWQVTCVWLIKKLFLPF